VEIVLDDGHEGHAEGVEVGEQRWHLGFADGGFDHGTVLDCLGERHALGAADPPASRGTSPCSRS
jgi:hypothetical protein